MRGEAPSHHANIRQDEAGDAWEKAVLYSEAVALIHIQQKQLCSVLRAIIFLLSVLLTLFLIASVTCTHQPHMYTDILYTHTFIIVYSFINCKKYLPSAISDPPMCYLHQCILAAPVCHGFFNICCSFSHWQDEAEKYTPVIQLIIVMAQEKKHTKPSTKMCWHHYFLPA